MTKLNEEPKCENCGKPLFGRTDKRFCNDSCRNQFNRNKRNQKKTSDLGSFQEISEIIKQNYQILSSYQSLKIGNESMFIVNREELVRKGYHFKFFTSIYMDDEGSLWKYCLDYGIKEEPPYSGTTTCTITCTICYRPEQIETKRNNGYLILKNR